MKGFYIFSTGSELSSGRSKDTNGPYIAQFLSEEGFECLGMEILPDDPAILETKISSAIANESYQGIIITGGLGPTADDYTVDVFAKIFDDETIEEETAVERLSMAVKRMPGRISMESGRRQCRVLKKSRPIKNLRGLAPGMILDLPKDRFIAAMPGVPSEMKEMFEGNVMPLVKERYGTHGRVRRVFYLYGIGESHFQEKIFPKDMKLPSDFLWGITAGLGAVKVFIESKEVDFLEDLIIDVKRHYGEVFLEKQVEDLLHEQCIGSGKTVAVAESCTGGLVGKLLTDRSGSSSFFMGGVVTYSNQAKEEILQVSTEILEKYGAVSEECAIAMAQGAKRLLHAKAAVSITGIAGPDGGSTAKPVGTVCIGYADEKKTNVRKFNLPFDRDRVREYSARAALFFLYKNLFDPQD